jgi:hypothetical protein
MLKVYGNAYADNKENFDEIVKALEAGGFTIAYNYENSGIIEKEVTSLNEDTENELNDESV